MFRYNDEVETIISTVYQELGIYVEDTFAYTTTDQERSEDPHNAVGKILFQYGMLVLRSLLKDRADDLSRPCRPL